METWTITITSPMGQTTAQLRFERTETTLKGEMSGKGGSGPMEKGRVEGGQLSWSCRIQKPMPMTLKFTGSGQGDAMSGKVKFGMFASGEFVAVRA